MIDDFREGETLKEDKYDPKTIGQKTLMLRTRMEVTTNFNLLMFLYLFGLKTVHPDSKEILKELYNRTKLPSSESTDYVNPKLIGYHRTQKDKVMY